MAEGAGPETAPALLRELARRLRLDKGWTSRAVDRVVGEGLVDEAAAERDRRTIALSLTRAGRAEHRRVEDLLDAEVARVIDRVAPRDRAAVERALGILCHAYAEELEERLQPGESAA